MTDTEKSFAIHWLINSGEIKKGKRRVGALYLDIDGKAKHGLRVVRDKKVIFDLQGDKLRKRGKPVATIDGNTITLGKKTFTIELTDPHTFMDRIPAWKLAVRRDDKVVVESPTAWAVCLVEPNTHEADLKDEIRTRVMFYLAWRELGG
jgi:hypothetical protein